MRPLREAVVPGPLGPALRAANLSKHYGHVAALVDGTLAISNGEIVAIVGDNGAGKSTFVKLLTGIVQPDSGSLAVHGQSVSFKSPADARNAGIASVYQDLALVECLDVATNMFLGQLPKGRWLVRRRFMQAEARRILDELGVTVASVTSPVGMLSGGQRQIVAIARAMRTGATTVLLDEPTAALGVRETERAKELMRTLRQRGNAVIVVSHDIEMVLDLADRVAVMRLGRVVAVRDAAEARRDEIVSLIAGIGSEEAS